MKLIIDTKENINQLVAEEFIKIINSSDHPVIGLATGSTPLGVYNQLAIANKEGKVSFKNVHSFNLDEYVGLSEDNEHYDEMISKEGGIDIQILGLGSDGHIAFNEPNTPFDTLTHLADLEQSTIIDNSRFFKSIDEVPTKAMTMGLKSIMNAKKIVLIAYGKNKAHAVKEMIEGPIDISLPASILQKHNDVTIYCDSEAASLLTK